MDDQPVPMQGDSELTKDGEEGTSKAPDTTTTQIAEPAAAPKKMISLKHVKERGDTNINNERKELTQKKKVFLPETDSKQDFPLQVSERLSVARLEEVLNSFAWSEEKLNSPTRMKDSGMCLSYL